MRGISFWGLPYISDATETPSAGATEVWQIFNLTGDTHPIHFHLVNVQVIQRQAFTGVPEWKPISCFDTFGTERCRSPRAVSAPGNFHWAQRVRWSVLYHAMFIGQVGRVEDENCSGVRISFSEAGVGHAGFEVRGVSKPSGRKSDSR